MLASNNQKPRLKWRSSGTEQHPVYVSEIGKMVLMVEAIPNSYFYDQGWSGHYYMPSIDGVKATSWGIGFRETWDKELTMVWCERQALYLLSEAIAILAGDKQKETTNA